VNADLEAGGSIDMQAFEGNLTMADGTCITSDGGVIRYSAAG
jgi:hypothetical protein